MKPQRILFPPSHWPRRYQYLLIAAALASICGLAIWTLNYRQHALQEQSIQLANAQAELAQYRQTAAVQPSHQNQTNNADLPAPFKVGEVNPFIGDMTRLAKQHHVQLINLSVEASAKTPQALAQRQITVQVKTDYANLKTWMGELMGRYPWLAVKSLNGQSAEAGLDINMTWVLYVED